MKIEKVIKVLSCVENHLSIGLKRCGCCKEVKTSNEFDLALEFVIDALEAMRWIPVSDRTPTDTDADDDGYVQIFDGKRIRTWCWYDAAVYPSKYTHWKRMPKKPEVKE